MADPRFNTKYEGIGVLNATYLSDGVTILYDRTQKNGSPQAGLIVTLLSARTVELTADGDGVEGKLVSVDSDGICTVQVKGFMKMPGGAGATLTLQNAVVGDLGASSARGYVRAVNSAVAAELAVARGTIVDPSVTTAVIVRL